MLWAEFSVLRSFLLFPVPMLFVQKEKPTHEVTAMPGSVGCAPHSCISSGSLTVNRPEISQPVSVLIHQMYHIPYECSVTPISVSPALSLFTCKLSFASYLKRFAFIDLTLVSDYLFLFVLS